MVMKGRRQLTLYIMMNACRCVHYHLSATYIVH
jgi:hypothetical protein